MPEPGDLPAPSIAERDRRWKAVREAMDRQGWDVLITPSHTGHWGQFQPDSRYLSSIGQTMYECFVVFPKAGEVTAIVRSENMAEWFKQVQSWVQDVRDAGGGHWSRAAIQRLKELNVASQRIGVSGLGPGLVRTPEGTMRWVTMENIRRAFPDARFENATEVMQEIRAVKSDEEIAFMERAAGFADLEIEAMVRTARPGVKEYEVIAEMHYAGLKAGAEYPFMMNFGSGQPPTYAHFAATHRVLQKGDWFTNEIESKYAGYMVQTNQPLWVGVERAPDPYPELATLCVECFDMLRPVLKPRNSMLEVVQAYEGWGEEHDLHVTQPMLHGRGLGDDRPLLNRTDPATLDSIPVLAGNAFILKPHVTREVGGQRYSMTLGDTVAVTAQGARRLGRHPLEIRYGG